MSLAPMITTLAESSSAAGVNPWLVGGLTFLVWILLMVGLLMFGAGRDHS